VAAGMTFVVISGNYLDLSVVAQVATAAVVLIAVSNATGIPLAMLLAVPDRARLRHRQRVAVGVFKANAVIVTLSTTFIGLGLLRWLSGGSIYFGPHDGPSGLRTDQDRPLPLSMLLCSSSSPWCCPSC
jgi:ribose transport system permease protein